MREAHDAVDRDIRRRLARPGRAADVLAGACAVVAGLAVVWLVFAWPVIAGSIQYLKGSAPPAAIRFGLLRGALSATLFALVATSATGEILHACCLEPGTARPDVCDRVSANRPEDP
jgi:hypothetical protein